MGRSVVWGRERRMLGARVATMGVVVGLAGCTAILGLRDDYELATGNGADGSSSDVVSDSPQFDANVDAATVEPPRQISPLSTATTSIQTPTFHWALGTNVSGAHVQICADRECTTVEQEFDAEGTSGKTPKPLTVGLHFWRTKGNVLQTHGTNAGAVWEFWVRKDSGVANEFDTSWGSFPDFDGDGYPEVFAAGGAQPDGFANVEIFPGKKFGTPGETPFYVKDPAERLGDNYPRAAAGDIDGDGYSDLVFGDITTNADAAADQSNRIDVIRGGTAGLTAASTPTWVIHVPAPDDAGNDATSFAGSVSVPGDVNGDGYADILASSQVGTNVSGPTYLFFGHADGPSKTPDALLHGTGVAYLMGPAGPIGDVDGDGYNDVLCVAQAGYGAWLFLGGPNGPSDATLHMLTPAPGASSTGDFAQSWAGAGDIDGDGLPDLVFGSPSAQRDPDGGVGPGQVYIFRGDTKESLFSTDGTLTGPDGNTGYFGGNVTLPGDLNNDGFDDLIVGAPFIQNDTGRAYYFPGSAAGVTDGKSTTITGIPSAATPDGWFGRSAQSGDLNHDNVMDVLIGGLVSGNINAYFGGDAGISDTTPSTFITSPGDIYILASRLLSSGKVHHS